MHRIDNATAATSLPVPVAVGPKPNAFFTKGNPGGGTPATIVDDDWANAVQEELCDVIESAGITLSKTDRTQLKQAIRVMVAGVDAVARFTTTANINLTGLGTQGGGDWGGSLTAGDVIFVQAQTTGSQNGWYAAAASAWSRVKWLDESVEVKPSMLTKVSEGTTLADTIFMLTTDGPITLGSTALVFTRKDQAISGQQIFTSGGSFVVPAGVTAVEVEVWGAGGGGASGTSAAPGGSGGAGGGYAFKKITGLVPGASITVTVGTGGTAGVSSNGGNGGSSSFGAYCSATGGTGGLSATAGVNSGVAGGSGTGGDLNFNGQASEATEATTGSCGGFAPRGGTGGLGGNGGAGGNGFVPGGGGGGGDNGAAVSGGAGANGMVHVKWGI